MSGSLEHIGLPLTDIVQMKPINMIMIEDIEDIVTDAEYLIQKWSLGLPHTYTLMDRQAMCLPFQFTLIMLPWLPV